MQPPAGSRETAQGSVKGWMAARCYLFAKMTDTARDSIYYLKIMQQLSLPFGKYLERTLPPREITSIGLPNPFVLKGRKSQLTLNFGVSKSRIRGYKRQKQFLFRKKSKINCVYCEKALSFSQGTVEHIIPKSKGGTNHISNLTIACHECNNRRQDHSFADWQRIVKSGFRDKLPYHFSNPFIRLVYFLSENGRLAERKYLR